jgi:shikimate 5-dehydrogenase
MKQWTSLSPVSEDKRWENLSRHLTEKGVANQYVPWQGSLEPFADLKSLESFHHVRMHSRIGADILKHVKVQSSWTTLLGVIDGMVKSQGAWWPLCAMYESYGQMLIELGANLDKHGSVLVAGAGGAARIAIAAFFKSGFRNFLVTNFQAEEAEAMIADVRAKFFGLDIKWVPMEKIVLLPGESSVLVNCTPSVEENALLIELSYLNFLKRPGFLFDITRSPKPNVLVQEALDADVTVLTGIDLAARSDLHWAKWAFQADLSMDEYRKSFEQAIG